MRARLPARLEPFLANGYILGTGKPGRPELNAFAPAGGLAATGGDLVELGGERLDAIPIRGINGELPVRIACRAANTRSAVPGTPIRPAPLSSSTAMARTTLRPLSGESLIEGEAGNPQS